MFMRVIVFASVSLLLVACGTASVANTPAPTVASSVEVASSASIERETLAFCARETDKQPWAVFTAIGNGQGATKFINTLWDGHDVGCWKIGGRYIVAGLEWSPDGGQLYTVLGEFTQPYVIHIPVQSNRQFGEADFTYFVELGFEDPQLINLSPSGDRLVFMGHPRPMHPDWFDPSYHIFVRRVDNQGPVLSLTGDVRQTIEPVSEPVWSPDGQAVAFVKTKPHNGVGIAKSDGSHVIWLTEETLPNIFPKLPVSYAPQLSSLAPVWFRDSSHLFFLATLKGDEASALFRVKRDGSELTKLADSNVYAPAISPNGAQLAFVTYDAESRRRQGRIVVADLNLQNQKELVQMLQRNTQPLLIRDLAWSPDGSYLAFAANPNGNMDLFVINADGTGLRNITGWPGDEIGPRWRPRR